MAVNHPPQPTLTGTAATVALKRVGVKPSALPRPDVTFNYLGRLDAGLADGWLRPVDEPGGPTRSPRNLRTHALDIRKCVSEVAIYSSTKRPGIPGLLGLALHTKQLPSERNEPSTNAAHRRRVAGITLLSMKLRLYALAPGSTQVEDRPGR